MVSAGVDVLLGRWRAERPAPATVESFVTMLAGRYRAYHGRGHVVLVTEPTIR